MSQQETPDQEASPEPSVSAKVDVSVRIKEPALEALLAQYPVANSESEAFRMAVQDALDDGQE